MTCNTMGAATRIAISDKPTDTYDRHRLRPALSVAVRTGLWVFSALWFFGCVNGPYDGQEVPNSWDPVVVMGAYTDPGVGIRVEAYDFNDDNWWLADLFISTDGLRLNQIGYPAELDWGVFYRSVTFPNRFGVWQRQVGTNGDTLPYHRARIRVTADAGSYPGPLLVLPQGYGDCTRGYSTIGAALGACGSIGSQRFADIHTPGYSEEDYVPRPVVVAYHSSVSGVTSDIADQFLLSASVVMQREDASPSDPDGSEDHACPVTFSRSGNVRRVTNCPATIADQDDLDCYFNQNFGQRTVIIAGNVSFCYGQTSGVRGCTSRDNRNVVVVDPYAPGTTASILWAHELLHSFTGGGHSSDRYNLLYTPGADTGRMTPSQCSEVLAGN